MVRPTPAVTVSWVTVGNPGNPNDTINTGTNPNYGAVGYTFRIMKFEWTNAQYVEFLNAVDPDGTNPNGIYSASMGTNARGGISFTSGNSVGSKYASRTNMADKPVNFVSWFDAARVANWLHNGAPVSGSSSALASAPQNTGAYTLGTGTSGNAPAKNAAAQYWIPTENEWYKAAYYKGSGTNAGYWKFGTQSSSAPTAVGATTVGTGSSGGTSPVITGNAANWNVAAAWGGQNGNVTTVGTNGGPSAYGAFDMTGNVRARAIDVGDGTGGNCLCGLARVSASPGTVTLALWPLSLYATGWTTFRRTSGSCSASGWRSGRSTCWSCSWRRHGRRTRKDRSANGTSASVGLAGRIMRSNRRSWLGRMRPDRGGAAELPIHAQGRIFIVGSSPP